MNYLVCKRQRYPLALQCYAISRQTIEAQIFTPSVISLYCFHILFSAVVVHCLFQLNLIKTIHKTCKSAELGRPAAAIVRPTTSDGTGVMPVDSKAKLV